MFPKHPDWLYNISYGLAEFHELRILLENDRYAVVQIPSGTWGDNSGRHYGAASYYLVDKKATYRKSVGLIDAEELQYGGRAKLAQWRKLIEFKSLTPRQARIHEIKTALKAGAGVFTGALTNELQELLQQEATGSDAD